VKDAVHGEMLPDAVGRRFGIGTLVRWDCFAGRGGACMVFGSGSSDHP
jgi:hypothetical protein